MSAAPRTFGRGARLSLGLQTVLLALLAVAAAVLAIVAAEWRPLRVRYDATVDRANSLDPQTIALLAALPEPARVDLLLRPVEGPLGPAVAEAGARLRRLLFLAREAVPGKLELVETDHRDLAALEATMRELDVDELNVAVVRVGERRTLLRLWPDVADLDPGDPDPRRFVPASVRAFRGEEALATALGRVASGRAPLALFTTGQGEPAIADDAGRELDRLRRELELEGFRVDAWDLAAQGAPPADCDVLCVVGPSQPFSDGAWAALEAHRARGGALFVVVGARDDESGRGASALLPPLGLALARGVACLPLVDLAGRPFVGDPRCSDLLLGPADLSARHPITLPLQAGDRRVSFRFARTLERAPAADGVVVSELAWTPPDAWLDVPDARGAHDWVPDPERERSGRFRLAAAVETGAGESAARAVVLASTGALAHDSAGGASALALNRDLVLNAFNWLCERDHRVRIATRRPHEARLDVARGAPARTVFRLALWGLPGLCLAAAGLTLLRRRG